ncbi:MAG: thioredoxin [Anaerovoracaceae bacterium]
MAIIHLTSDNFEAEAEKAEGKVLIDFWATWCGPCQMIGPVLEDIAASDPGFKICKVNVDEEPELAKRFMVRSIPMLVVMKDGKTAAATVGAQPKSEILKFVENA